MLLLPYSCRPPRAGIHLSVTRATARCSPAHAKAGMTILDRIFELPTAGSKRAVALDLGAVHDPPGCRVEGVAPVHDAAIVPQDQVARAPLLVPGEFVLGRICPQRVEQRLAFGER